MGNAPSKVPYGAQISAVNAPLSCSIQDSGNDVFNTLISSTATLIGGSGQQIYFSDVTGQIAIPSQFALNAGSAQYSANVTIVLDVTNASPSSLTINQNVQENWSDPVISFPSSGGVLDPLGPVTLGNQGQTSDLKIRTVDISIQDLNGDGTPSGSPRQIFCGDQGFQYIISSVAIDDSTGPPLAPANGVPGTFLSTLPSNKTTIANVPINCEEGNSFSPSKAFNLTIGGTGPAATSSGSVFNLSNFNTFLTVPGDVLRVCEFWQGKTCLIIVTLGRRDSGNLPGPGLNLSLANASPATIDGSRDFIASEPDTARPLFAGRYYDRGYSQSIVFPLPNTGTLSFANITAGQSGATFAVDVPFLQGDISIYNIDAGQLAGSESITCRTKSRIALLGAPIVNNA